MLVVVQELVTYANGSYDLRSKLLDNYSLDDLNQLMDSKGRQAQQINQGGVYIVANVSTDQLKDGGLRLDDGIIDRQYSDYTLKEGVLYIVGLLWVVSGRNHP